MSKKKRNKNKLEVSLVLVNKPEFVRFEDLPGETNSEKFKNAIEKFKAEQPAGDLMKITAIDDYDLTTGITTHWRKEQQ